MKTSLLSALLLGLMIGLFFPQHHAVAGIEVYPFEDSTKEKRFLKLIEEMRCPKCQNANLAGSNAGLASDLKQIIYEKVQKGESNEEITAYLKQRYGDFISYNPPVKPSTWLIWYGPFALLLLGGWGVFHYVKSRQPKNKIANRLDNASEESIASSIAQQQLLEQWENEIQDVPDPSLASDLKNQKIEDKFL